MNEQRRLLVVSGPSGVGKDTVVKCMTQKHPGVEISVSATTRPPRPGEADGEVYHFVTRQMFEENIRRAEMLEYTNYLDHYYGTLKSEVDQRIQNGVTCVLIIEVEGASKIKSMYPDCTTVFIMPPSMDELEQRLRKRGSEDEGCIARRLEVARREMAIAESYDYRLVNETPDSCADELYALLEKRQAEA